MLPSEERLKPVIAASGLQWSAVERFGLDYAETLKRWDERFCDAWSDIRRIAGFDERFFRLWCRNQWKRERYAPSFHLDDENLDPKTWCRFPILSGGFERELVELREYVEQLAGKQDTSS